jgi:hypothetical protein
VFGKKTTMHDRPHHFRNRGVLGNLEFQVVQRTMFVVLVP